MILLFIKSESNFSKKYFMRYISSNIISLKIICDDNLVSDDDFNIIIWGLIISYFLSSSIYKLIDLYIISLKYVSLSIFLS